MDRAGAGKSDATKTCPNNTVSINVGSVRGARSEDSVWSKVRVSVST